MTGAFVRVLLVRAVVFALLPLAGAAVASAEEAFSGRGYLIACGEEGCFVNSAGYDLFVAHDRNAALLDAFDPLTAIEVEGTLSEIGDATASLALTAVTPVPDDPYEGNLRAMQGDWRPVGTGDPVVIGIYGMDWNEVVMDEVTDRFMMVAGDSCADGTAQTGMVISLYRYGDDPDADACWQLEQLDSTAMTLRDLSGDQGAVVFERVVN